MGPKTPLWIWSLGLLVVLIYGQNSDETEPRQLQGTAKLNANDLKTTRAVLNAELEKSVNISLRETIANLLSEKSLDDRLNSEVVSELMDMKKRLKRAEKKLRIMKRKVNSLTDCKANTTEQQAPSYNETPQSVAYLEHRQNEIVDYLRGQREACLLGNNMFPQHKSRLLLTSFYKGVTDSYILDMKDHSLSTYPYLRVYDITATVYDPVKQQIVFSRYFPNGIYAINFNDTVIRTYSNNVSSFGLALDQGRELIFMTTHEPEKTVSRMTTSGDNLTTVVSMKDYGNNPNGIAIDSVRRMLYVSAYDSVFSMDYDGNDVTRLYHKGQSMLSLTLDLDRDYLYFFDKERILRRSLSGNKTEEVDELDNIPVAIRYYDDTVYIACKESGDIFALDVNTDKMKKIGQVDGPPTLCLIP